MNPTKRLNQYIKTGGFFLALCMAAPAAKANIQVNLDSFALGEGIFQYELSVANSGPEDVAIVSIVDAPVDDPLIALTLEAPAGFNAAYDPGSDFPFGFIDLLEGTSLFAAGTVTSGFRFQSAATFLANFTLFEALTVTGNFLSGTITIRNVPETGSTLLLLIAGIGSLACIQFREKHLVR